MKKIQINKCFLKNLKKFDKNLTKYLYRNYFLKEIVFSAYSSKKTIYRSIDIEKFYTMELEILFDRIKLECPIRNCISKHALTLLETFYSLPHYRAREWWRAFLHMQYARAKYAQKCAARICNFFSKYAIKCSKICKNRLYYVEIMLNVVLRL